MTKILLILLVAMMCEAVGVVYLSRGMKQVGGVESVSVSEVVSLVKRAATNSNMWLGIVFDAAFFAGLLILMSKADVSFIWPLTSVGLVLTTLAAKLFLHEEVSVVRWMGVILIMVGSGLVTFSEKVKSKPDFHREIAKVAQVLKPSP